MDDDYDDDGNEQSESEEDYTEMESQLNKSIIQASHYDLGDDDDEDDDY